MPGSSPPIGNAIEALLALAQGSVDGKIVVQVYFSQRLASRVRFSKMLLGFGKLPVEAGETKRDVRITLKAEDLGMWSAPRGEYITEPGTYSIMVGQSSVDPKTVTKSLQVVA